MIRLRHLLGQTSLLMLFLLARISPAEAAFFVDGDTVTHRPRVALVLGGGGAKGAAHVGALKVLEQVGIQPDIIVGTSIGAIVGGLHSIGYSAADLDTLFRSQQWLQLFTREAIRGNAIKDMLDRLTSRSPSKEGEGLPDYKRNQEGTQSDSLSAPSVRSEGELFACIAADLPTLSEVVLTDDSLARNMRASMAIPGVFRPVKSGDYVLLDGGLLNNLPVDVARRMGADIVIAIDLTVNHHEKNDDDEDFDLSEIFDTTKVKGLLGWLLNRPDFTKYKQNCQDADLLINPPLNGYAATSFARQRIEEMILLGEQAARNHIGELQKIQAKLTPEP